MSTTMSASIQIGGKVSRRGLARLVDALRDDGACLDDWSGPHPSQELIEAALGTSLEAFDAEASWGRFAATEEVCVDIGLTFVRYSGSDGEYDAEVVWYDATTGQHGQALATEDGDEVVSVRDVRRALASTRDSQAQVAAVTALLAENSSPGVPALTLKAPRPTRPRKTHGKDES